MDYLGSAGIGWFPLIELVAHIVAAMWFVVMNYTAFGKAILAIDGNARAAAAVGINVRLVTCLVFVLLGASAALSGLFEAAMLMNVSPDLGQDSFNMLTMAVVVIGGTSMKDGRNSIVGTVAGTLLVVFLEDGLQVIGLSPLVDSLYQPSLIKTHEPSRASRWT
jgi:ribose/xylose/arabinose/galactoside ABC-type transport system permease subunit